MAGEICVTMADKQVHIIVRGRVQGVFYRAHAQEEAEKFQLAGWVKNNPDGSVEIVAEGDENRLRSLVDWCRRGPASARVTDIKVTYSETTGEFESFSIKYF